MNKKFITILLIIGLLTAGLGLVSANETLTDDSAVATAIDEDNSVDAQSEITATEDTQENVTLEEDNTTTEDNNTTEFIEEEYDLGAMKEIISTLDDDDLDFLADNIEVNNENGEYDDILDILNSDEFDIDAFMEAVDALDDESFLTFVDILNNVLSDLDDEVTTQKVTPKYNTNKNPVNTVLEKTGISNAVNDVVKALNPKQASNDKRVIVTGPGIIDLACEAIDAYFNGRCTFEELLDELDSLGLDTSLVTQNDDGSLTIDGKVITSVQDFLDAIDEDDSNATTNSTNTTVNDTNDNVTETDNSTDAQEQTPADSTSDEASAEDESIIAE